MGENGFVSDRTTGTEHDKRERTTADRTEQAEKLQQKQATARSKFHMETDCLHSTK